MEFRSGAIWCRWAGATVRLEWCMKTCSLYNSAVCSRIDYAIAKCPLGDGSCYDCALTDRCAGKR